MRRPHVYERTAPRVRRPLAGGTAAECDTVARAALDALPDLLRRAEEVGAVVLARYLGQALSEAEGIVKRSGMA